MNNATLLLRQVHPSWIQDGEPSSQTFKPTKKDENKLSVDDGDIISAEDAHILFVGSLGQNSVGVLAVSGGECESQELPFSSTPETNRPSHSSIDFSGLTNSKLKSKAKALLGYALSRDWLFEA